MVLFVDLVSMYLLCNCMETSQLWRLKRGVTPCGLYDPEANGTTILRKACNYVPVDTAQRRRKLESLVGCLWEPQFSDLLNLSPI